jgi:hypothetical protein
MLTIFIICSTHQPFYGGLFYNNLIKFHYFVAKWIQIKFTKEGLVYVRPKVAWQRATPVIVGWFVGLMGTNNNN